MMREIIALYRDWFITVTDDYITGERFDSSGDRFECHRQGDIEKALRMAKGKVDWNEGPEEWNQAYENEALR